MSGNFGSKSIVMLTNFNGTGVGIGFGIGCGFGIGWGFGGMPLHTLGLGADFLTCFRGGLSVGFLMKEFYHGGGCGVGFGLGWGFGNAFGCHYRTAEVKFQGIDFGKEGQSGRGQIPDSAKQSQTTKAA